MSEGLAVGEVRPGSIAAETGVAPGDRIVAVNGRPVRDLLDYRFYLTDEHLTITLIKENGEAWLLEIEKGYDEDFGVGFTSDFPDLRRCGNRCLFCFVDQMPPGLRPSLYVKDDDFRLSFAAGNFVTLTNVGRRDLERIIEQRLSPLYVSVHTTNPDLRRRLMGNPRAGEIMAQLGRLTAAGIEVHTQVVLCPGLNDGHELRRTVRELAGLQPGVQSLAIVPVGRTRFRRGLYPLRAVTGAEAGRLIGEVEGWQRDYREHRGRSFVYLSDEFYLLAGRPLPPARWYDDFPQLENGVGLARRFLDEWYDVKATLPAVVSRRRVTVVTGRLAAPLLEPVVDRLNRIAGLAVELAVIDNNFFGRTVTVSGLITGRDLRAQLAGRILGDLVIIPAAALKEGRLFLDDVTRAELHSQLGVPVVAASGPRELVRHACGETERRLFRVRRRD